MLAHARRLLAGSPHGATAYIHADLREPDAVFGHPDLRRTLDLNQPVALTLIAVLHFFVDGTDPYGHVARLAVALPAGSYFAVSHATTDFRPPVTTDDIDAIVRKESARSRDSAQFRDKAAVARFFDGMDLVAPGLVALPGWRNDDPPDQRPSAAEGMAYAAVARVS